jgi:hydrogenase/urease accessory protein HupE
VKVSLLAVALVLWAAPALAHDEAVSTSDVTVDGATVTWRVEVGVAGLAKVLALPSDLTTAGPVVGDYLRRGLTVILDGRPVAGQVVSLEPRSEDETGSLVVTLRYPADRPIETLRAHVAFFSELTRQHRAVLTIRWGGAARQLVRLGPTDLQFERATFTPSALATAREFLLWGMEHIFIGYDHIAFLVALLLVAAGWSELLRIVTSFTVAHSLTLLLSALDVIRVPSRLTEVLIAASIVYVAAENLWMRQAPRARWALTFAFGLVHGMGFATELRVRLAAMGGRVVLPVVAFNVGVELGQIAIVAAVFPVLLIIRRTAHRTRVVRWGSAAILVLGLGWLIERLSA